MRASQSALRGLAGAGEPRDARPRARLVWPDAMPDTIPIPRRIAATRTRTLKSFGQPVAGWLATSDNRGVYPDVVVDAPARTRSAQAPFLAGRSREPSSSWSRARARAFLLAPTSGLHGKRLLFPTFAILGSTSTPT